MPVKVLAPDYRARPIPRGTDAVCVCDVEIDRSENFEKLIHTWPCLSP